MKHWLFGLLAFVAIMLAGCSIASPGAGKEAVWVEKPALFGHGGVDCNEIVTTGVSYGALTSDAVYVDLLPQRVDMKFDDMMTKSGVPVSFHVLFTFKTTDGCRLVKDFGVDPENGAATSAWNRVMDSQISQLVRDTVKRYDMQDIAISQTAVDEATANIVVGSRSIVEHSGMPIQLLAVNVGRIMPPDAVSHQRIETAAQEQRVITERQRKLAEDARKDAEQSRASADNAYRSAMSLSPDQYVQLERIKMERDICQDKACTVFLGAGPTPTLNVK